MTAFLLGALLHLWEGDVFIRVAWKADSVRLSFPNETNTGPPTTASLTPSGPLVIKKAGTVVENVDVVGSVVIDAPNVTLRNCRVRSGDYVAVKIKAGGAVVQNCDIDNLGAGGAGISGAGTFIANNIHGCVDGINVAGDNTVITDNYIHDMAGPPASHFDSIQADGNFSGLLIEHNTVINEQGQTSALMLDNYWGPIDRVKINNNLLIGGGYTVYIDEVAQGQAGGGRVTNVVFTNNVLSAGHYGILDIRDQLGDRPAMSGNRDLETGRMIPGQTPPTQIK
jgi:hypothetical protein